jgi:VWFA-related protein
LIASALYVLSQETTQSAQVVNVEVPVRVLHGDQFIDNLTLQDFEIFENGIPQKIEALYLIKNGAIAKREESQSFQPKISRTFYLLFQMLEYDPKLEEALKYLFSSVLLPGDSMTVVTPMKPYNLSSRALAERPKQSLAEELQHLLRKDIQTGGGYYREMIKDLRRLVKSISRMGGAPNPTGAETDMEIDSTADAFSLEYLLPRYKSTLQKMEDERLIDEGKLINFAGNLKKMPGQKIVVLFYQREMRPEISQALLNQMMSLYQDSPNILSDLMDLFQFYKRDIKVNIERIRQAFADASLDFHFIFMDKEAQYLFGINFREQSEDVFNTFSEAAKASGGIVDNSSNPSSAFKKAMDSSNSYYLLYYAPANYVKDGRFKDIRVKTKDSGFSVAHRSGYFAN